MDVTEAIPRTDFTARASTPATTPGSTASPNPSPAPAADFATQVQLASGNTPTLPTPATVAEAFNGPALVDFAQLEITKGLLPQQPAPATSDPQLPLPVTQTRLQNTTPADSLSATNATVDSVSETTEIPGSEDTPAAQDVGTISVLAAIAQSLAVQPVATTIPQPHATISTTEISTNQRGNETIATNDAELADKRLANTASLPPADFARSVARSLQDAATANASTDVTPPAAAATPTIAAVTASVAPTVQKISAAASSAATPSVASELSQSVSETTSPALLLPVATDANHGVTATKGRADSTTEDAPLPEVAVPESQPSLLPTLAASTADTATAVRPASHQKTSVPEPATPRPKMSALHASPAMTQESVPAQGLTPPDSTRPIAATVSPQDTHQLVEQLGQLVLASHDRGEQLVARVSPPDMGTIVIEVQSQGGDLVVRMEASSGEAQQLLVEHLPQLHETLNHLGLSTERIEIVRTDTSAVQESGLSANVGDHGMPQPNSQQQSEAERQRQLELEQGRRQQTANAVKVPVTFQRLQELNVRV